MFEVLQHFHPLTLNGGSTDVRSVQFLGISIESKHHIRENNDLVVASDERYRGVWEKWEEDEREEKKAV